jgi:hypothetical protein
LFDKADGSHVAKTTSLNAVAAVFFGEHDVESSKPLIDLLAENYFF